MEQVEVLRPRQVSERLGCGLNFVYRLFDDGTLKGFRVGFHKRIYAWSVEEYLQQQSNGPKAPQKREPKAVVVVPKHRSPSPLVVPGGFRCLGVLR